MCRLFHKPSDVAANCDEVENVNATPTTTRCSREDNNNSSEMFQETAASRVHAQNISDDTERCPSDKGSDVKPDDDAPVIKTEKSVDHAETSRARDRVSGKSIVEVISYFDHGLGNGGHLLIYSFMLSCAIGKSICTGLFKSL